MQALHSRGGPCTVAHSCSSSRCLTQVRAQVRRSYSANAQAVQAHPSAAVLHSQEDAACSSSSSRRAFLLGGVGASCCVLPSLFAPLPSCAASESSLRPPTSTERTAIMQCLQKVIEKPKVVLPCTRNVRNEEGSAKGLPL